MTVVSCSNGHYYDKERYGNECPFCKTQKVRPTCSRAYIAFNYRTGHGVWQGGSTYFKNGVVFSGNCSGGDDIPCDCTWTCTEFYIRDDWICSWHCGLFVGSWGGLYLSNVSCEGTSYCTYLNGKIIKDTEPVVKEGDIIVIGETVIMLAYIDLDDTLMP